jgi:hypothetical protein
MNAFTELAAGNDLGTVIRAWINREAFADALGLPSPTVDYPKSGNA